MRSVYQSCRGIVALGIMVALCTVAVSLRSASGAEEFGPRIGSAAPQIGEPLDAAGKPRSLASVMGDKGLVLFFYRSADWCPYCQLQLIDLNSRHADIARRGYGLAGISYDSPEMLKRFSNDRQIKYALLSDPKSEIIDRYGLRDPAYAPGHRAHGVPRPIIFVLDRAGIIRAKLFEETYRTRPAASLVVETLDRVGAAEQ
jgi:peroxiredoxin